MTNPTGPWSLIRQLWARNFQQNPAGTVLGSVLAIGGIGLLLFFGFFIVLAVAVIGGLIMLAQALLGGPRRTTVWTHSTIVTPPRTPEQKTTKNNELEGEYTVVTDKADRHE